MTHALHNTVYAALETIANSEKITRATLAEMSRDLLSYVPDTNDIDIVNRLIGVLTPMNRQVAILFFTEMLAWQVEKTKEGEFSRFGGAIKGEKSSKKKWDNAAEFLADPDNTIWTWANKNVDPIAKKKDFASMIAKAVENALKGHEKSDTDPLTPAAIVAAVFTGGVSLDDMLSACADQEGEAVEAEPNH
tara:strand:+ start:2601 stop:3173 length:573 start_codon:yes stop_codon:yes gene_type:complete